MSKLFKLMFLTSLFTGSLISISSYSWMGMWLGLEINLLSIIPLMTSKNNISSSEASIKYFITQAIASTIILMAILILMTEFMNTASMMLKSSPQMALNSALFTKMGIAPFHFWLPEIIEGLNWMNCLLMLTWQKLAPMVILMYMTVSLNLTIMVILLSMIVSGIMSMNQISMRKILTYSSINHMGWMMASLILNKMIWLIYFSIYMIMTINIILILNNSKIFFLQHLFQSLNKMPQIKFMFILNFLSLGGIPPLIGFFPKWLTIQLMIQSNFYMLPFLMIIFTLFMIFIYMRISMTSLIMNSEESNWTMKSKSKNIKMFSMTFLNYFLIFSLILVTLLFNQ